MAASGRVRGRALHRLLTCAARMRVSDSGVGRGSATLLGMPLNETLSARRASMAATWGLTREIVLVPSGLPIPIAGTDQSHLYHAHPEHRPRARTTGHQVEPEHGESL